MSTMRIGILCIIVCVLTALVPLQDASANSKPYEKKTRKKIDYANRHGPYLGLIIPNLFELNPLLHHPSFKSSTLIIDVLGKRFRFGTIEDKKVVLVMTGLGMVNAGVTTQLLLSLFRVKSVVHYGIAGNANPSLNIGDVVIPRYWAHLGLWYWQVVHYGIAGNANPSLNIGDVVIPRYWAHLGLWYWQRYGDGPKDKLALEDNGDYTRKVGYLKFANYTNTKDSDNSLNNVWYQPEEIFPVNGTPEKRQHAFWIPVNPSFYKLSKNLEGLKLERCVNKTTCLSYKPKVVRVERGGSAGIYLDNAAYRSFIHDKFKVSPVEMESAAVALICYQQGLPFITIRALSDLAGAGSSQFNEAATFSSLAATNSVHVVIQFINHLCHIYSKKFC